MFGGICRSKLFDKSLVKEKEFMNKRNELMFSRLGIKFPRSKMFLFHMITRAFLFYLSLGKRYYYIIIRQSNSISSLVVKIILNRPRAFINNLKSDSWIEDIPWPFSNVFDCHQIILTYRQTQSHFATLTAFSSKHMLFTFSENSPFFFSIYYLQFL